MYLICGHNNLDIYQINILSIDLKDNIHVIMYH